MTERGMRLRMAAAALVLGLVALSGCGRKGSPEAPGPGDQITYPRGYPSQ